ncbi:MAG: hypothetical protein ACQERK_06160 [Campylobacterota bacterium]
MYTLIALVLLLIFAAASVLLYYQIKHKRLHTYKKGECPNCGAKPKRFFDRVNDTYIEQKPIKPRLLKGGGCSGASAIEYYCKECEIKEVFHENSGGCGI